MSAEFIDRLPEPKLCCQPERESYAQNQLPSDLPPQRERQGREQQKSDVHRQDVKQRRPVDQQCTGNGSFPGSSKVEIEQIVQPRTMTSSSEFRDHYNCESQQYQMVDIKP
ncbi:MAG: hypothetical protein DMG81_02075 [Acidobacteria bacterium]|nr:MAG: hypothetical protein DMG81_02075 [Acidobacteriota bacterium]